MLRLTPTARLIVVHWVDSLVTCLTAATAVIALQALFPAATKGIIVRLSDLGVIGLFIVILGLGAATGVLMSRLVISAGQGLRQSLTGRHVGMILKAMIAAVLYLGLCFGFGMLSASASDTLGGVVFALAVVFGCLSSWLLARLFARPADSGYTSAEDNNGQQWLHHDRPIISKTQSEFPEHLQVAHRVLARLMPLSNAGEPPADLALIGPYGSGKTSICNLVAEAYGHERGKRKYWPDAVFCRFEAWQYITPEAAVSGLVGAVTGRVLAVADVAELWRIPEQYLAALAEGAGGWGKVASSLLGARPTPEQVLARIGDVLTRLGTRLIVFVDDLDRIEESAPDAQRAVTQALNQLQGIPAIQYVIAVGPTHTPKTTAPTTRPARDLLKLTRFQEFVPRLNVGVAKDRVLRERDRALEKPDHYYPWAKTAQRGFAVIGPQTFLEDSPAPDVLPVLLELLDTPRSFKSALREASSAWDGGLDGEINWYDLLLACALKTAEPALFEWIERNRETFLHRSLMTERPFGTEETQKALATELKEGVLACLSTPTADREKTVHGALAHLFPAFALKIGDPSSPPPRILQWEQRIADNDTPYFERFLFGRVMQDDTADQPTLQYIRRITSGPVVRSECEAMFLATAEKQTGILNKLVQFAALLTLDRALEIGRIIVDWIAVPEHVERLDQAPAQYRNTMCANILHLLGRAGEHDHRAKRTRLPSFYEDKEQLVVDWVGTIIDDYAGVTWQVPWALMGLLQRDRGSEWGLSRGSINDLAGRMAKELVEKYVMGDSSMATALDTSLEMNCEFLRLLAFHPRHDQHRTELTGQLVREAGSDASLRLRSAIIWTLIECRQQASSPAETECVVKSEENDRRYDMAVLVPALERWRGHSPLEPMVNAALMAVLKAHGVSEGQGGDR